MRKLTILVSLVSLCFFYKPAKADTIGDQIKTTLLDHVETVTEFTTTGRTQLELLDTVIQIGKFDNNYLAGIDAGLLGDTRPVGDQRIDWTIGIHFHLAPLIRKYVSFNPEWTFLNSVEVNPRYSYDFTEHHGVLGLSIGLAFGLKPV